MARWVLGVVAGAALTGCAGRAHVGVAHPLSEHPAGTMPMVAAHLDAVPASFSFKRGVTYPDGVIPGLGIGVRTRPHLVGGALAAGPEVCLAVAPNEGVGGALRVGLLPIMGAASDGWADLGIAIPVDLSVTFAPEGFPVTVGAMVEYDRWATPWLDGTWWGGVNVGVGW